MLKQDDGTLSITTPEELTESFHREYQNSQIEKRKCKEDFYYEQFYCEASNGTIEYNSYADKIEFEYESKLIKDAYNYIRTFIIKDTHHLSIENICYSLLALYAVGAISELEYNTLKQAYCC